MAKDKRLEKGEAGYEEALAEAYSECQHYNKMGGFDDTMEIDIAFEHKVPLADLHALTEEGL